jgi:3-phenylpropionate/trans-cinnamate dioxygenase ferredoxin subunit
MGERKLVARIRKTELPPGARMRLDYPPFGILLVNLAGVAYAIDDTCNHAGESLSKGQIEQCRVVCPAHGYVFDVRTGHLVEPAGLCDNQRTFEVTAEAEHFAVYDEVLTVLGPG